MTREIYLKLLNQQQFNYLTYFYFIEKSGVVIPIEVYRSMFEQYINDYAMRYLLDGQSLLDKTVKVSMDYFNVKYKINEMIYKEQVMQFY